MLRNMISFLALVSLQARAKNSKQWMEFQPPANRTVRKEWTESCAHIRAPSTFLKKRPHHICCGTRDNRKKDHPIQKETCPATSWIYCSILLQLRLCIQNGGISCLTDNKLRLPMSVVCPMCIAEFYREPWLLFLSQSPDKLRFVGKIISSPGGGVNRPSICKSRL